MIRVMTDNAANLPPELREQYGIRELCLTYTVNGVPADMSAPFDGYAYYEAMRKGAEVKTSMITPLAAREAMEPVLAAGDDVLYVGLSGGVSGTCWGVSVVAQELQERFPDRDIRVLDTRGRPGGQDRGAVQGARPQEGHGPADTPVQRHGGGQVRPGGHLPRRRPGGGAASDHRPAGIWLHRRDPVRLSRARHRRPRGPRHAGADLLGRKPLILIRS